MRADEIGEYIYIYEYQINEKSAIKMSLVSLNFRIYCFSDYFRDPIIQTDRHNVRYILTHTLYEKR